MQRNPFIGLNERVEAQGQDPEDKHHPNLPDLKFLQLPGVQPKIIETPPAINTQTTAQVDAEISQYFKPGAW